MLADSPAMTLPDLHNQVAVHGDGALRDAIAAALPRTAARDPQPGLTAVVVASDADNTESHASAAELAARHGVPWLPVRVDSGWVLIGPAVRPSVPGCPTCVERRRRSNRPDAVGRDALRTRFGTELGKRRSSLITPLLAASVSALVAAEADRLRSAPGTALTDGALLMVGVTSGLVRRHPFIPDPLCPDCGERPPDGPHAGAAIVGPAPEHSPGSFRVADLSSVRQALEGRFVDPETGFVQSLISDMRGGVPMAVAHLAPARTTEESHHGYGRCDDFAAARATAIVEALERVCGIYPRSRRTVVRAPYAEVADQAIDPRALGLYPDDRYDLPDFYFTRFQPDRPTAWVWAYSFAKDAPILVPESYAYFGPRPASDRGFVYETSNGCAIGGCRAEAVLHGLLEVAERDAFLTTWYCRLPIPRVELDSAADRRIPMLAERIGHRFGYRVRVHVAVLEQGLPVFWVMAVDASGDPRRHQAVCVSGARLDPERALRQALTELGPTLQGQAERYDPAVAARLAADPDAVERLEDHPTAFGDPEAAARLDFLPSDGPALSLAQVTGALAWPRHGDVAAHLAELAGRYLDSGLDVICVDITSPEARAAGLSCAKVIVPGTVSIAFGHRHRRTHGLPRLLSRPRLLGYRDRDLELDELNPFPHPFP